MTQEQNQPQPIATDTDDRVQTDAYDPHIIPAETAARKEREGDQFKTLPTQAQEASTVTDDQTGPASVETTSGYTVDREGLLNNYAIEPEMYYEVPGDARQSEATAQLERQGESEEINQDETGKLTMETDSRGKGSGIV